MSVNIYPAYIAGNNVTHADDWDEGSTMNLANGNFYSLAEELGLSRLMVDPGHISVKALAMALKTYRSPRYSDRLLKLIARAEILRATHIAFS